MKEPDDILRFWFGAEAQGHWFSATDAFDAMVRREFETTAMTLAAQCSATAKAHAWEIESPQAHLALILALDQFPRNMYRNTVAAFAWDSVAVKVSKRMIERKTDIHLPQTQRPFAYMPLMHSEKREDQEECVRLCDARLDDGNTLKHAKIHRDIILRFGRFPHRNQILGRHMSVEEQAFLDAGGFSG